MALPSLYSICLQRVYDMVLAGMWKNCSSNPFSNLPSRVVDNLLGYTRSYSTFNKPPTISDVFLLLTSGKVTSLDLTPFDLNRGKNILALLINSACFESVRVLTWLLEDNHLIPVVHVFVILCLNLEEFHSRLRPNFEFLSRREKLRVFKFYPTLDMICSDAPLGFDVNFKELSKMRNLEAFYLPYSSRATVAEILKHCPQLISLGFVDSLDGLTKYRRNFSDGNLKHLNLRRCIWGKSIETKLGMAAEGLDFPPEFSEYVFLYRSLYLEKITNAVFLCPLVEELVVCILKRNCFDQLKNLKQLTLLNINLCYCDDDYIPAFSEFLEVIGHQLLHLSITCPRPFPVDIILKHCSILETLEIDGAVTKTKPVPIHLNVFLKSLRIKSGDKRSLFFLLSSCKSLEEICLGDVSSLDDYLLCQILAMNPLRELKILGILNSSLSRFGFQKILEKAISLKTVSFSSFAEDISCKVKTLIRELHLYNIDYIDLIEIKNKGVFRDKLNISRF